MKNTIITSISALVFLVIGLFIGRSNKQIEVQTVLKTNIVEKPVKEYVDKDITNVIEKFVERELSDDEKQKIYTGKLIDMTAEEVAQYKEWERQTALQKNQLKLTENQNDSNKME